MIFCAVFTTKAVPDMLSTVGAGPVVTPVPVIDALGLIFRLLPGTLVSTIDVLLLTLDAVTAVAVLVELVSG